MRNKYIVAATYISTSLHQYQITSYPALSKDEAHSGKHCWI